jgi:phenylpropionate dioxygenase-like ring-hydroxylating dioxygenase large terminal subunit
MELEKKLIENFWHLIGHKNEFSAPGNFVLFDTCLGEIAIHNNNGKIIAFDNKCIHRGASIFDERFGNKPLTCKYHGWTYIDGRVFVPNRESFIDCNFDNIYLNEYQVDWCGDFLFIAIKPQDNLKSQLGGIYSLLEKISFNIDRRLDFNNFKFPCYWPLAIENALESYHIPYIHRNTLAKLDLQPGKDNFFGVNSVWNSPIGNLRSKKLLGNMKKYFEIDFVFESYMSIYIFPFSMLSSTYGFSYSLQNFFPSKNIKSSTEFSSRFLVARHNKSSNTQQIINSFFDSSIKLNRTVFEEDSQICKQMSHDTWSNEKLAFQSPFEEKIEHFRSSCLKINS